ncbi:MAG TPA: type 1 glutamine amidotransferase, partial [Puia sp.]|nr:type 1 glutamine amidotransferase [Puia sp.]
LVPFLASRGDFVATTAVYDGQPLPKTGDFDGLIIMGGPMSVHDEAEYSWLRAEKELIGSAIRDGKKVLGICLGAQLIAEACGARVYKNKEKEIGFWPVKWAVRPGFTGATADNERFFHWHGETFDLPAGAGLLASTAACVNQAFRLGDRVMGVQFHPEVTAAMVRRMVGHGEPELVDGAFIQQREEILAEQPRKECMDFLADWL